MKVKRLNKTREFEVKEESVHVCVHTLRKGCQQVCLVVFIQAPHCTSPPCLIINWPMRHEMWAHLHNIDSGSSILSRHCLPSSYPACIAATMMYFQYKSPFETSLVVPLCPLLSPYPFLFLAQSHFSSPFFLTPYFFSDSNQIITSSFLSLFHSIQKEKLYCLSDPANKCVITQLCTHFYYTKCITQCARYRVRIWVLGMQIYSDIKLILSLIYFVV